LIAILLRVGTKERNVLELAQGLLARFEGLAGLSRASFEEICTENGMAVAKTAQLKAALEIGRRLLVAGSDDVRPKVTSPADAAQLLMGDMSILEQEHLKVILLDTKNNVHGIKTIYQGNVNTSLVRIAELFRDAIRANCPAIIAAHNHPSGDPSPSPEDVLITERMVEAGRILDIDVLDHLVIGQQKYVSLKERGLGFK
jgi:DNA repair protein RadC